MQASVCGVRQVREIALRATGSPPHELDRWFDPIEDWGPLLGCVVYTMLLLLLLLVLVVVVVVVVVFGVRASSWLLINLARVVRILLLCAVAKVRTLRYFHRL